MFDILLITLSHWCRKVLWILRSSKKLEKVIYTVHSNTIYPWFLISKTKPKLGVAFFATGPGLGLIMYIFTTLKFPTHILWLSSIDNECKCQILLFIYPYVLAVVLNKRYRTFSRQSPVISRRGNSITFVRIISCINVPLCWSTAKVRVTNTWFIFKADWGTLFFFGSIFENFRLPTIDANIRVNMRSWHHASCVWRLFYYY